METITYLVANYNNARYVEDCLVSLKNQTCERWRCIVCDDVRNPTIPQRPESRRAITTGRKETRCAEEKSGA